MTLSTDRLKIIPLTVKQLELWISNLAELEKQLNCSYKGDSLEGFFGDIVAKQLEVIRAEDELLWRTFWLIVVRSSNVAVGSIDFKAPPLNGEVEIGYGITPQFEGNGYVTEAVKAMCDYAFACGVKTVIAETEADNVASQRVLIHNGFTPYKTDNTLWWRLERNG